MVYFDSDFCVILTVIFEIKTIKLDFLLKSR